MTQLGMCRKLMPVLRVVLPFSTRRRRYLVAGDLATWAMAATFPIRQPGLWWFCHRVRRAMASGQTIIEA